MSKRDGETGRNEPTKMGISSSPLLPFSPSLGVRAGIVVAVLFAAGCGGGKASVTGRVSYKGKLLATGTVSMVGPDGMVRQGAINPDGTYTVTDVAAGKVQIGVLSQNPAGDTRGGRRPAAANRLAAPPAGGPRDASSWFAIPSSYQEPTTSGLSTVLSRGSNQYDIDLQ